MIQCTIVPDVTLFTDLNTAHHILNTERMIQSSHFYRQRKITSDQHRLPIWKDLYSVQKWNNEIEIVLHNINLMRIKNLHQSSLHDK